jgi:hypothetical protein
VTFSSKGIYKKDEINDKTTSYLVLEQSLNAMTIRLVIFIFVFGLPFLTIFADDPCRFEYPGKGVIDLTSVGRTDGTPAFADRVPPLAPYYSM